MRKRGRKLAAALGVSVAVAAAGSSAYGAHWATGNGPVGVCFTADGLNARAVAASITSAAAWDEVTTGLRVRFRDCGPNDNIVAMDSGFVGGNGALAVTTSFGGEIVQAAAITYDTPAIEAVGADDEFMWRVVTCHEMGHALGLDHSVDTRSCMQTAAPEPNDVPGPRDEAQLVRDYGGIPGGFASAPPAADDADADAAGDDALDENADPAAADATDGAGAGAAGEDTGGAEEPDGEIVDDGSAGEADEGEAGDEGDGAEVADVDDVGDEGDAADGGVVDEGDVADNGADDEGVAGGGGDDAAAGGRGGRDGRDGEDAKAGRHRPRMDCDSRGVGSPWKRRGEQQPARARFSNWRLW